MNKEQALDILIKSVQIGQKNGAFTLADAKVIAIAVEVLSTPTPTPEVKTPEVEVVNENKDE